MKNKGDEGIEIMFDATSNNLKNRILKKQIKNNYKNSLIDSIPKRIERMGKIPSFISKGNSFYYLLIREARENYISGYYHSTIAMVGIIAERFSKELEDNMDFKLNGEKISLKKLFRNDLNQYKRLKLLLHGKLIKPKIFSNLDKIRKLRNNYIHYNKKVSDLKAKKDSLKALKLFIEVLNFRFSEKYEIKNGRIVER